MTDELSKANIPIMYSLRIVYSTAASSSKRRTLPPVAPGELLPPRNHQELDVSVTIVIQLLSSSVYKFNIQHERPMLYILHTAKIISLVSYNISRENGGTVVLWTATVHTNMMEPSLRTERFVIPHKWYGTAFSH